MIDSRHTSFVEAQKRKNCASSPMLHLKSICYEKHQRLIPICGTLWKQFVVDCFLLETELEENGMESFDSSKEGI